MRPFGEIILQCRCGLNHYVEGSRERGLSPSILEQDQLMNVGKDGWYLDFLCLRVKIPDLEPGVLILPLPSCVTWTE